MLMPILSETSASWAALHAHSFRNISKFSGTPCPFFQKHQQVEQHYLNEEPSDSRLEPGGQAMLNPCELWSYRPTPSFCLCILGSSNFSLSSKTFVERKKKLSAKTTTNHGQSVRNQQFLTWAGCVDIPKSSYIWYIYLTGTHSHFLLS